MKISGPVRLWVKMHVKIQAPGEDLGRDLGPWGKIDGLGPRVTIEVKI